MPNGTFCAGESLGTNIIIRCVNGVAGPGNCNDNLVGEPPIGNFPSTCWQTSNSSGDAACAKKYVLPLSPTIHCKDRSNEPPAASSTAAPAVAQKTSLCPTAHPSSPPPPPRQPHLPPHLTQHTQHPQPPQPRPPPLLTQHTQPHPP